MKNEKITRLQLRLDGLSAEANEIQDPEALEQIQDEMALIQYDLAQAAKSAEQACPHCGVNPLVEVPDIFDPRDAVCEVCRQLTWDGS